MAMPVWLKEKLYLKTVLRRELRVLAGLDRKTPLPKLLFSQHHQAHAASAFYASPYQEAAVICLDGVGEWATSTIWHGQGNQLRPLAELHFPHSLGLLYSAFTYYCGFKVNSGEYKLMGLAPYGEPKYVELIYRELISVREDGSFALNMRYFAYPVGSRMINQRFAALFGAPPLTADAEPGQLYLDLAASIQQVTEEIVLKIARHAQQLTGHDCVLPTGKVWVETHAQLQQRCDAPLQFNLALGGLSGAGDHFQQRALARTVDPDNPQRFARLDLEGDVLQHPGQLMNMIDQVAVHGQHRQRQRQIHWLKPGHDACPDGGAT